LKRLARHYKTAKENLANNLLSRSIGAAWTLLSIYPSRRSTHIAAAPSERTNSMAPVLPLSIVRSRFSPLPPVQGPGVAVATERPSENGHEPRRLQQRGDAAAAL